MNRRDRSPERAGSFTRRTLLLGAAGAAVFGGLAARMWQLQVVETEQYGRKSEDNRFFNRPVAPSRGLIVDRYGAVIAGNSVIYQIHVIPEQMKDERGRRASDAVLDRLLPLVAPNAPAAARVRRLDQWRREISRKRAFDVVTLEEEAPWDVFSRVNLNLPYLPGVILDAGERRAYGLEPIGGGARRDADAFAHVVGYVSKPTEDTVSERLSLLGDVSRRQAEARILRHPNYRMGRAGIESTLDERLQGSWGEFRVEVDAYGRTIREVGMDKIPKPGEDVRLTLDAELQAYAQRRLEGESQESGAAVAIDVDTGELMCLVSAPSFDPNLFAAGIHARAYKALVEDERKPLYNKPLAGLYPPGSTFKMITALAALRAGVAKPTDVVYCNGATRLGDREFHCWKRQGHGRLSMRNGIKQSCDLFFYEMAKRVGIERLAEEARRFGLGSAFPLMAPGSRDGVVPNDAWKRSRYDEAWAQGETLITGIGQGYLLAAPIQLAVMVARIATGKPVAPRITTAEPPARRLEDAALGDMVADPEHLAFVRDAMKGVVEEPGGTAYWALRAKGVDLPGIQMGGKTGTSQVRRISKEERDRGVIKNEDLPWRRRDHALFVCFAPVDKPRYAVAVVVEHGGSGSSAASPTARDIMRELLKRDPSLLADAGGDRA